MSNLKTAGSASLSADLIFPKISVITSCLNSESTISRAIASVNAQTYQNIEHVFVDGLSSDSTLELIRRESDVPNVVISERDAGIYDALNKGIKCSSGDVLGFLHSDDFLAHSDVLSRIAAQFAIGNPGAVYGDLNYVSSTDSSKVVRRWQAGRRNAMSLKLGWMPPHPTLYLRKKWYDVVGNFDSAYSISGDYHLMLRLFSHPDFEAHYIEEVLVVMKLGGISNRSLTSILKKMREDHQALKRAAVGGIPTLVAKNMRKLSQFF